MTTLHRGDDELGPIHEHVDCVRCEDHGRYVCGCRSTTSHNQPDDNCPMCRRTGLIGCQH